VEPEIINMDDDVTDDDHSQDNEPSFEEWSGSGIWERVENRRWEVVRDHILPMRDLVAEETSLMANLGIGRYLQNFESEVEVGPGNFKIVSSGSSLVRLADEDAESLPVCDSDVAPHPDSFDFPDSLDHEPAPGPSGVSTTSRLVPEVPVVPSSSGPSKSRKRCFGRGKKKQRKRLKDAKRRCTERMVGTRARSAESSPGRRTPSPSTLASICQYWEECLASPQYIIQSDSD